MKKITSLMLVSLVLTLTLLQVSEVKPAGFPAVDVNQQNNCVRGTFPNYHNEAQQGTPPAGYDGPIFKLSQEYPDTLPPQEDYPWLAIPFENSAPTDPEAYLTALKEYGFEGNWEVDWVVQNNGVRNWYHVPWQDYSAIGREFVHGLTHELDLKAGFLGPNQTDWTNTWAVAFFNDRAGWAIGQMWCDPKNPQPDMLNPNKNEPNWFPEGSMVIKLLFNTISDEQSLDKDKQNPFMKGSFTWQADIYVETVPADRTPKVDPERAVQPIRLLQIDVAVRDSRSPTGWLFGSYTYDGREYVEGDNPLNYLAPIGIQWGNDPGITPEMIAQGAQLKEAWVNDAIRDLVSNHLGWGQRVAGPADNPGSSCMSCHMTAGVPAAPILPVMVAPSPVPNERYLNWFINLPAGVAFGYNTEVSLDYSLQLSQGLQNFLVANNMTEEMLLEKYSPRGPERTPPAALAAASEPASQPDSDDNRSGTSPVAILAFLVLGVVVGVGGTILLRR